jgi:hypothetical protein
MVEMPRNALLAATSGQPAGGTALAASLLGCAPAVNAARAIRAVVSEERILKEKPPQKPRGNFQPRGIQREL